jgi:galactitol-specific phosphotransferase system IIB component
MFEKDSENSNEDISYEVWGNKTRLFYDALGRKTQARPETRRYLFLPKKKMLNYEQDSWLSGSTSFMLKTSIDGFVNAKHYANIAIQSTEISSSNSKLSYANVLLILSTEINRIVDQNDPNLIRHENKHIEIYNNLGNRQWNTTVPFNGCSSVEEQCSDIKEKAWQEIERQFRLMIQAQNKWDDDDKNNVSHERINEEGKVKELKGELEKNYKCGNKK